jgi:AraC family transcriptional activator FtrA
MRAHRVAVPVLDGMPLFELAVPGEVFGMPRPDLLKRPYEVQLCRVGGGPVRTAGASLTLETPHDLTDLVSADTVMVPALAHPDAAVPPELIRALREAAANGARVTAICSGAFVLAEAGLLDGRKATTHWMYAADLAARYPSVEVLADVLYLIDGAVATSAGTAAGIDLCLELVRLDHGTAVAAEVARRLVVPPHRQGGQAQYVSEPLPARPDVALGPVLDWVRAHLDEPLTLTLIARQAGTTTRTLSRRFLAEVGQSPLQWLSAQRVRRAQRLLETTDLTVDRVAARSGLGSAANMRIHFTRVTGTTPSAYRAAFNP